MMKRRAFSRIGCGAFLLGSVVPLSGCGGESRQTGTVVKTPPEDIESREASAAAYKAMQKGSAPVSPK
jgi:hypothetical protein